jgi:IS5 family transposase
MSWKVIGQTATTTPEQPKHQALQELDDVNALIDWASIEAKLSDLHASKRGEKAWPPLMMFKALLLQSWYNLSDPGLEKQLVRDLLFREFCRIKSDRCGARSQHDMAFSSTTSRRRADRSIV